MACQQNLLGLGQAKVAIFIAEPIADCISTATAVSLCLRRFRALRREAARCK